MTEDSLEILALFFVPKLFMTAEYKGSSILAGANLNSKGQFNATIKDLTLKAGLKGSTRNGFMNVYRFSTIPNAKDMKLSVTGLFQDPTLSE